MEPKEKNKLPEKEKDVVDLSMGRREPENEDDREMLEDIKEIEDAGGIVEIPWDDGL